MGRHRNVIVLVAAIFIQVIGLAVQVKRRTENDSTRLIRVWTVTAITPLEKGFVGLQTGTSNLWHNYVYLRGVRQENRELQDKIQHLQLEQVRLRQDAEQARRLQALLGFKEQFIDKTTAAQVIGSSGSEQSRTVYLDKGSNEEIRQGMAVISSEGIVGKVIQVFPRTSQVLLINDQTSGVGTILEQSRLQGVLKGKASGQLVLDKIMTEEDVKLGDRVLTSGGDQIFPKGLPVGTVADIKRGGEFLQVTVKPAAALNHLEEVLVITKKQEREPELAAGSAVRASDILAQRLPTVPDEPVQPESPTKPASGVSSAGQAIASPSAGQTQPVPSHATTAPNASASSMAKPLTTQKPTAPGTTSSQAQVNSTTAASAPPKPVAGAPLLPNSGRTVKAPPPKSVPSAAPDSAKPATSTPAADQPSTGDTPQ